MGRGAKSHSTAGYGLIELLVVLAMLAVCLVVGSISLGHALLRQEARGAAQSWQAASAWGQTGVLWHGGGTKVAYEEGGLAVSHDFALCGGDLGASAPAVAAATNVVRWHDGGGVAVRFVGGFASPDAGGSIYFQDSGGRYRVVVRPESGLTVRSRVD